VLHGYECEIIRMEYDPAEIVQVLFDQLERQMQGDSATPQEVIIRPELKVPQLMPA
jgi:hypothetical protein